MNEARQTTLMGRILMPVAMLQAFLLSAVTAMAQDAPKDVNVDINMHGSGAGAGAGGWYTMWWVWVIIAVFIIVIVALTTRGGGSRSE